MSREFRFRVYNTRTNEWEERPVLVQLAEDWGVTGQRYVKPGTNRKINEATWDEIKDEIDDDYRDFAYQNHKACDNVLLDFADADMIGANYEVMQYTGRKDRNDKSIYELDIVEITIPAPWDEREPLHLKGIVTWDFEAFYIRTFKHESDFSDLLGHFGSESIRVLGNKYDNPDLLPGDDNDE